MGGQVGRLVGGWSGVGYASLPPCVSVPSSWRPPRQADGTAPLGWPECSIKKQPSLEDTSPPFTWMHKNWTGLDWGLSDLLVLRKRPVSGTIGADIAMS